MEFDLLQICPKCHGNLTRREDKIYRCDYSFTHSWRKMDGFLCDLDGFSNHIMKWDEIKHKRHLQGPGCYTKKLNRGDIFSIPGDEQKFVCEFSMGYGAENRVVNYSPMLYATCGAHVRIEARLLGSDGTYDLLKPRIYFALAGDGWMLPDIEQVLLISHIEIK